MSFNVASVIGSGTLPYTYQILDPLNRGSQSGAGGVRIGAQVMIGNPEDMVAVDAFSVSGISISTTPIKIFDKNVTPLPRCRLVRIANATDSTTLFIANSAAKTAEGWPLVNAGAGTPRAYIDLPVLDCVQIWAVGSAAVQVRMLIF